MWYITRYALTRGVQKVPDEELRYAGPKHFIHFVNYYEIGENIFETEEEAKANAVLLAQKAIAAAERKIAKLERLIEAWSE